MKRSTAALVVAMLLIGRVARADEPAAIPTTPAADPWGVYVAIGLSGACALGAEVAWTRVSGGGGGESDRWRSADQAALLAALAAFATWQAMRDREGGGQRPPPGDR